MTATQRQFALEVARQLRDAGFESLWAGGCVRDQLLGIEPKDYDVATNARPEQVQEIFGKRRTLAIGAAFGVIAILSRECRAVEVATFRSDGAYVDGRRPSAVEYTTAKQDAQRRDFTINGMFYDPLADKVIDYVGGREDLAVGIVRAIGDPAARFSEDKLRLLRAVRFATTFDFEIEPVTLAAIRALAPEVSVVSAERIGMELSWLLTHPRRATGVMLLIDCGLLAPLIPELAAAVATDSEAWLRTIGYLKRLDSQNLATALAALIYEFATSTSVSNLGRRLRFSNKDIEFAEWLVKQLSTVAEAHRLPWSTVQRVLVHDGAVELMALARAVLGDDHPGVARCELYSTLPAEQLNPTPLLTGDDLIRHQFRPGPGFASLLNQVRDAQLEGQITTQAEALELARKLISQPPEER